MLVNITRIRPESLIGALQQLQINCRMFAVYVVDFIALPRHEG